MPDKFILLLQSFFMGVKFDTVISGYILAFPLIMLTITALFKLDRAWSFILIMIYIIILYCLSFFICSADIPYFKYYFTRLNVAILSWTNSPGFMFKMVLQSWGFLKYFFLFVIISVLYIYFFIRLARYNFLYIPLCSENKKSGYLLRCVIFSMLTMLFLFIGIRGRFAFKSPIRTGSSYFCELSPSKPAGAKSGISIYEQLVQFQKA